MGMFDYLQCDLPLPEGARTVTEWQTKDLDSKLGTYAIRADGRLVDARIRMEPKPGTPPAPELGTPEYLAWHSEWYEYKEGPDEPERFTGGVTFYGTDAGGQWWEFAAWIEDGRCLRLRQTEPEGEWVTSVPHEDGSAGGSAGGDSPLRGNLVASGRDESLTLYVRSMGKALRVTGLFASDDEANDWIAKRGRAGERHGVVAAYKGLVYCAEMTDLGVTIGNGKPGGAR